jgi:hypothetical protein
VRKIVNIEEPAIQTFMPDIAALSVIHRDRDKREKRIVPKCKQKERCNRKTTKQIGGRKPTSACRKSLAIARLFRVFMV